MEIFLPDDPSALEAKLSTRILPEQKGVICPDTAREHALALRKGIVGETPLSAPLIMTGHQPLFYPPGILIKNLLAGTLARALDGTALNLVVDTDEEELVWRYPVLASRSGGGVAVGARVVLALNRPGAVLGEQGWEAEKRAAFMNGLEEASAAAGQIFPAARATSIQAYLRKVTEFARTSEHPFDAALRLRESYEREIGLSLRTVFVSELIQSAAYRYFVDSLRRNAAGFRAAYNSALREYRRVHRIKNPAQPLPDLDARELPFWVVKDGRRVALLEEENIRDRPILPRAVTLTLFCRLFLGDLFIHGRGGARYDQITDAILINFFNCSGAPYTVASATLALEPREEFPLKARLPGEIDRDIRDLDFDPARFLAPTDPLRRQREELIARWRARKDPAGLHREFVGLRERARARLGDFETELLREKERAELVARNRDVFFDREYPFFFYDLTPLHEAVRPYAALRLSGIASGT